MKVEVIEIDLEGERKMGFKKKLQEEISDRGRVISISKTFRRLSFILRFIKILKNIESEASILLLTTFV